MANQPTKYRKFVVGAASAALVASAVAPVAFAAEFTDVKDNNSHKEAIGALSDAGVITGYPDGTFQPNKDLTRSDVVKLMGKWLLSKEGYSVPADYKTNPRFTDLTSKSNDELLKMAAVVKDNGIFNGSAGKLLAADKITRENMAVVLVRALDTLEDFDLASYVAKQEFKKDVSDLTKAKAEARPAIDVLDYFDITNPAAPIFNPKSTTTRAQFASLLYKAAGTDYSEVKKAAVTVESVESVNATTTEVTLTEANADATAKDFKVLVGGAEVVPTSVTVKPGTDNKVYTIVHASLAGTSGTLSVNGKEIAFNYKEPAVKSAMATDAKTITVTFDQAVADTSKAKFELLRGTFKQNVTAVWAADKKSVQLVGASNFQPADYTVNVSGLTEKVLTNTVKIEAQKISSIEIMDEVAVVNKAVNANGVFPAGTTATVGYVVKDQYGTDITKTTTTLTTNDSTTIKVNSAKGVVELSGSAVEGKKVNDIVPVVLVDTNTGMSVTKTVKLSAESTVSSIAVAGLYNTKGEEVTLNDQSKATDAFIVLDLKDQYGKEITEVAKATGLVVTNTNPTNLTLANAVSTTKIDGKDRLVIKITDILKAGDTDVLLISTTNGQSAKYTVKVSETATTDGISVSQPEIAVAGEDILIPVTVTDKQGNLITDKKLLSSSTKGIKVGGTTVAESALVLKDGQVYYKTQLTAGNQALVFQSASFKVATLTLNVKAEAKATIVRGLKTPLVISTKNLEAVTINAKDHLVIEDQYGRVIENAATAVVVTEVGTSGVVTVAGNKVTGVKNGTATLKIKLATENGTIDSAVEVPVKVTDGTEYTGYEVANIGKIEAGQPKAFTVSGLLNDGKVALQSSEYTATVTGGKITTPTLVTSPMAVTEAQLNVNAGKAIDTEFTLKVTINATGEVLEQKFTVSPDAKVVQDFFFTTSAVKGNHTGVTGITEAMLASGSTVASANLTAGTPAAVVNFATTDQYGNKNVVANPPAGTTFTIVPEKAGEVTIENNGTMNAKATLTDLTKPAKVTIKVKVGNSTKDLKVTITTPQ